MLNQNPIFIMSLSGSIVFLLYKLWYPIAIRYFPPKWRRNMLIMSMAFYLVPFPLLKYCLIDYLISVKPDLRRSFTKSVSYDFDSVVISSPLAVFTPFLIKLVFIVTLISAIAPVCAMLFCIYRYFRDKRKFLSECTTIFDPELQAEVDRVGIRRKVLLYSYPLNDLHTPVTLGVFHPAIVIPSASLETIRANPPFYILTHELTHIKNWDALTKMLCLLTVCVHWFNPLSHRLFREITAIYEICCDEEVTRSLSQEQCRSYFSSMLDFSSSKYSGFVISHSVGFADKNSKILKRRFYEMNFFNRTYKRGLALLSAFSICICALPTAFAYSIPIEVELDTVNTNVDINSNAFVPGDEDSADSVVVPNLPYEAFFTDEDGNVYEFVSSEAEKSICPHNYDNGTFTTHTENSTGGCTVKLYSAQRCILCSKLIIGDLTNTIRYDVCPH